LLWNGTAQSVIDLNPPGFYTSTMEAIRVGIQVGSGARDGESHNRALAWRGTRESVVDLHALLPAGYRMGDSLAKDVDVNGDIVGTATEDVTQQTVAVLWRVGGPTGGRAGTRLTVRNVTGRPGQTVILSASLRRTDTGAPVAGRTVWFAVNRALVGSATTNAWGIAARNYRVPANAATGSRTMHDAFAGESALAPAVGAGTLSVR
jgi:hypothetical protein